MILALETAAYAGASVALLDGSVLVEQIHLPDNRKVSAQLVAAIAALLDRHDAAGKVTAIATDCGPGSFTGIRIGIAVAKGLSDGWQAKTIGVSQFDLFLTARETPESHLILIDAKSSGGFYYELRSAARGHERGFVAGNDLHNFLSAACPDGGVAHGDVTPNMLKDTAWRSAAESIAVDATAVGRVALQLAEAGRTPPLEPIYLHPGLFKKMACASWHCTRYHNAACLPSRSTWSWHGASAMCPSIPRIMTPSSANARPSGACLRCSMRTACAQHGRSSVICC
jgi:tRNA threonylcarbamoyl adenosine modification protein YeaZ